MAPPLPTCVEQLHEQLDEDVFIEAAHLAERNSGPEKIADELVRRHPYQDSRPSLAALGRRFGDPVVIRYNQALCLAEHVREGMLDLVGGGVSSGSQSDEDLFWKSGQRGLFLFSVFLFFFLVSTLPRLLGGGGARGKDRNGSLVCTVPGGRDVDGGAVRVYRRGGSRRRACESVDKTEQPFFYLFCWFWFWFRFWYWLDEAQHELVRGWCGPFEVGMGRTGNPIWIQCLFC